MNNYAFNDMFKNMFDFNQFFSTQRRNAEALSAANQVMVENAQAISRRGAEITRENVETVLKASKDMMAGGSPEVSLSKNAEAAKDFFENALSNVREMVEMVTKSSFEAFDVLNKRAAESMEEVSKASAGSVSKKKSA